MATIGDETHLDSKPAQSTMMLMDCTTVGSTIAAGSIEGMEQKDEHQAAKTDTPVVKAAVVSTSNGCSTVSASMPQGKADVEAAADRAKLQQMPTQVQNVPLRPGVAHRMHHAFMVQVNVFKVYLADVKRSPSVVVVPLLVLIILVALGVYGVHAGADDYQTNAEQTALSIATDTAASLKLNVEKTFTPLVTLATFIKINPNFTQFQPLFVPIAEDLLALLPNGTIQQLQVSPMGLISAIYPYTISGVGIDIFYQPTLRPAALTTVALRDIYLQGPLKLVNATTFANIVRFPIFIKNSTLNETFGTNRNLPTNCTSLCWNAATQEKFWGFVTAIINMEGILSGNDSRLQGLVSRGYHYKMTRPDTNASAPPFQFAGSPVPPEHPVSVQIGVSNQVWTLCVEPEGSWRPTWEEPLYAAVVVGALIITALVAATLMSRLRQQKALEQTRAVNASLAATTERLEQEKLRLDALLVRQYNLISVLGNPNKNLNQQNSGGLADSSRGEGLTLERIEQMRRQLAVSSTTAQQDIEGIQTQEILGEGMFGKVYRGLWRGTVVAVKTMVLPANMSGAEKREKMAVMEAAISSSLSHPNIVQTYTYAIRPVRDNTSVAEQEGVVISGSTTTDLFMKEPRSATEGSVHGSVHSYEVRLVLEYCDRGSLRDALDAGAFLEPSGSLNYSAVLETASDIAKAMVHLHASAVLHSDLKARNVMLRSSGMEGRGVMAKVADFGLSVKMDHMETHISSVFQGTMTHMAPEILLEGRISKAADVYAFGIVLWELFTGGHPFKGVPRALLGHKITREAARPVFPANTPYKYRDLAQACWATEADRRPTFDTILNELLAMREAQPGGPTPLVRVNSITHGLNRRPSSVTNNSQQVAALPKLEVREGSSGSLASPGAGSFTGAAGEPQTSASMRTAASVEGSAGDYRGDSTIGGPGAGGAGAGGDQPVPEGHSFYLDDSMCSGTADNHLQWMGAGPADAVARNRQASLPIIQEAHETTELESAALPKVDHPDASVPAAAAAAAGSGAAQ